MKEVVIGATGAPRLNPYSNGRYSTRRYFCISCGQTNQVLILILMEDTLRGLSEQKSNISKTFASLNPYSNGRYSTS